MRQPTLAAVTTFPALLTRALGAAPGRPLITFYDLASGERTELSVTSYANWVAKTGSLLVDELDLERGDRVLVDLPLHWLGPVFLGAAWSAGIEVVWDGAADLVVCGPDAMARHAATGVPVLASALLPLGVRFPDPVPEGVRDYGVEVWGQPDGWQAWDPPQPQDPAVPGLTQARLWETALGGQPGAAGRLLTTRNPASPEGLEVFTTPFAGGGSLVLVALGPDNAAARLDDIHATERATARG